MSLHLQPLQECYCETSGSPASTCVMRRHYSIMYTQSLHATNGLLAVARVGNLLYGRPSSIPKLLQHPIFMYEIITKIFCSRNVRNIARILVAAIN